MIIFEIGPPNGSQQWGLDLGVGSQKQRISQKWVADTNANITTVNHEFIKNGSPSDNVTLSIYSGGTNPENGTLLGTSVVSSAVVPTSTGTRTAFVFSSPIAITNGTTYWFTWTRDTIGTTDFYTSRLDNTDTNAWAYVPLDGGWEVLSPSVGWDIQILDETGATILARPIYFKASH